MHSLSAFDSPQCLSNFFPIPIFGFPTSNEPRVSVVVSIYVYVSETSLLSSCIVTIAAFTTMVLLA